MRCEALSEREEPKATGGPRLIIDQRYVMRRLYQATCVVAAGGIAVVCLKSFFGREWVMGLAPRFNMDLEGNVPTWFSTMLLAACSLATAMAGRIQPRSWGGKRIRRFFNLLAVIFLWLSLDEAASFHELLHAPFNAVFHTGGFFRFAWVIPGAAFALLVAVWSLRTLKMLPAEVRRAMVRAGAVYCAGALGMEMIGGKYLSSPGLMRGDWVYGMLTVGEETMEILGAVLFLGAVLHYVSTIPPAALVVIGARAPGGTEENGLPGGEEEPFQGADLSTGAEQEPLTVGSHR